MQPTRIDIRHMRYALAVADKGGFRSAAKALNIAQPAISKSVKDTETDLGYPIFDRTMNGVVPTARGLVFLEDSRQVVAQFQRAIRALRQNDGGTTGHIILGYSALAATQQMSPGLEAFHAKQRGVQIEMHMLSTDTMMRSLKTGEIDIGFLLSHPTVSDPEIIQSKLWTSKIGIVCPRGPKHVTLDDLRSAQFVMGVRENWRSFRAILDKACSKCAIEPTIIDEAWDIQVIFQRVAAGRGITFFPLSAAESLPASLDVLPIVGFDASLTISMAWSAVSDTALLREFRKEF